jgi:hypothetical protein
MGYEYVTIPARHRSMTRGAQDVSDTRAELLDLIVDPDAAYDRPPADLAPAQLVAADELFQERREQIPLLAKRAADAGIDSVSSFADLVPLLFAHTVYKSYPQSFYDNGRWDRMLQWLDTLSVADVSDVDVTGVTGVDDWIERLWDAGHAVVATSGSSGKCSFLNHTMGDRVRKTRHFKYSSGWPFARADGDHAYFWLGPSAGRTSAVEAYLTNAENWGRPDEVFALSDEPLLISDISEMAAFRTRMANGTATPDEIADIGRRAAEKAERVQTDLAKFTEKIMEYRDRPIFLSGMWGQHMMIIERARELGAGDGEFHPDSVIGAGGGVKGVALPTDYQEQVARFYGDVVRLAVYGMTELAQALPRCEANRYHAAPGLVILPLDESGQRLLTADDAVDGLVEARFGFLDLAYEGRWGGLITGDRVTVDFAERCPCGRSGPTLLDNIGRFVQAGQDDHIGCAGTIDSYIRGAVGA